MSIFLSIVTTIYQRCDPFMQLAKLPILSTNKKEPDQYQASIDLNVKES